jgi:hypothetical protein
MLAKIEQKFTWADFVSQDQPQILNIKSCNHHAEMLFQCTLQSHKRFGAACPPCWVVGILLRAVFANHIVNSDWRGGNSSSPYFYHRQISLIVNFSRGTSVSVSRARLQTNSHRLCQICVPHFPHSSPQPPAHFTPLSPIPRLYPLFPSLFSATR